MWVSGRMTICSHCGSRIFLNIGESFDEQARIWVGYVACDGCHGVYGYSRRAETPEEVSMAKGRTAKKTVKRVSRLVTKKKDRGAAENVAESMTAPAPPS